MKLRFLTAAEFKQADDARMELAKTRLDGLQGASLYEITGPAVAWYATWYFDPKDPADAVKRANALKALADGTFGDNRYLSRFYWESWSGTRPPIAVICPNGVEWCVDAKSSNGHGWRVEGSVEDGTLKCSPSIAVPGYHGWLGINGAQPGHFTKDVENRLPYGKHPYGEGRKPGSMFGARL